RHQLERQLLEALKQRPDDFAAAGHDMCAAPAVHDQRPVRPDAAEKIADDPHRQQQGQDRDDNHAAQKDVHQICLSVSAAAAFGPASRCARNSFQGWTVANPSTYAVMTTSEPRGMAAPPKPRAGSLRRAPTFEKTTSPVPPRGMLTVTWPTVPSSR